MNGWFGVHHTSVVSPLPRAPSELITEGNKSALPMVTIGLGFAVIGLLAVEP